LARERYWGTPLPIWVDDENGDMLCIGSVAELEKLTGQDLTELDLHRPYVDEITFPNPSGKGGTMRRVPELIDVWFDSGAMPIAQWGYPHKNQEEFKEQYPADYICEAIDQTRGWFYTLHSISSMIFEESAFKNVLCLGHILDGDGYKMSKSRGNIVEPWAVLDAYGADALRWYLYTSGPPGEPRRFSVDLVGEVIKKFWSTLWNTYSFFVMYANLDEWTPDVDVPPVEERALLDRWVLAELHQLTKTVTEAMDNYDVTNATRPVQAFVEVLSNWYVRLSRRRFWKSESDGDKLGAYATLHECLATVAKLIAPTMPFMSETLYRNLVVNTDESVSDSVHLAQWPEYNENTINETLVNEMQVVRRLVKLGLAARNSVSIGVRQPLANVQFGLDAKEANAVQNHMGLIQNELNVKQVSVLEDVGSVVDYALNPLPSFLGKKFGKDFPKVQKALRDGEKADVREWAETLLAGKNVTLELNGDTYEVMPEECEVNQHAADGYSMAEEKGYLAALDVTLTEELILEGLSREVVRRVQSMRRDADFDISDNIDIVYSAGKKLTKAIKQFADYIKSETLALSLEEGSPDDDFHSANFKDEDAIKGENLTIGVRQTEK
jgi:isoleucyl-tRNA synthetase